MCWSAPKSGARHVLRTPSARRVDDGAATDAEPIETNADLVRAQHYAARFVGAGVIAYSAAMLPVLIGSASLTASWWPPLSAALIVGPAIALLVGSFRPTTGWILPAGICSAAGYLLATALWFVAWNPDTAGGYGRWPVWLVQFPGVPGLALVIALRFGSAIGYLVVATAMVHTANQLAVFGGVRATMYTSTALTIGLTGVFMAVGIVTMRTAQKLGETRSTAVRAAEVTASAVAREAERSRYDALIHDHVIACLLALRPSTRDQRVAEQARQALDEIDAWRRGDREVDDDVPPTELLRRVRLTTARIDENVECAVHVVDTGQTYPATVVEAVLAGLSEAMRNSVRHAGDHAERVVGGELAADALWVGVADDGVGFDPGHLDSSRFGIDVGLIGRMRAIGGDAEVRSAPGRGTVVRLSWSRT